MGDASSVLTAGDVRHLLRRTGFGAPPGEVSKILGRYPTRGAAADYLLGFKPSRFQPRGKGIDRRQDSWLRYMLSARAPLQEKLVMFWHDHFATNFATVGDDDWMGLQNQLLRLSCKGNFKEFVKAINVDLAMMDFLDTRRNRKREPNENYARELLELFTLGVYDFAGNPNYAQSDIVQIARAFSGWRIDRDQPEFDEGQHDFMEDYPERGPKVVFTEHGGFGSGGRSFAAAGEGAAEIDTVIEILFDHTDTDGRNTVARRTTRRLLEYFCHAAFAETTPQVAAAVDAIVDASGFDGSWDLEALLYEILVSDAFFESAAPAPWTGSTAKSVKWPIDYLVTAMRTLGVKPRGRETGIEAPGGRELRRYAADMGQELFEPPSVFGWKWETSWVTSATMLARARFARDVVRADGRGRNGFQPGSLVDLSLTDPAEIVSAVAASLGVDDQVGSGQRSVLEDYLSPGGGGVDLESESGRTKLAGLFIVLLQSPAFQLH
jgi:uncharacterized protein (DUF1800 family)